MIKNEYKVIGVMSGTSLDGIDLAYITFNFNQSCTFNIEKTETVEYDIGWLEILQNLVSCSMGELKEIDARYAKLLVKVIDSFVKKYKIETIDAICSHGHTALHQPDKGFTYQIGNRELLSKELNLKVVCDFRVQDLKLGGQGAPLVPIGDQLLFGEYDYCLNLGGFANISMDKDGYRIAYDICPVNIVLNHYARKLGFNFDDMGKMGSEGTINRELLNELNKLEFYNFSYPKSLGYEWVETEVFPLIDGYCLKPKDVLRTFVEHVAMQISKKMNMTNSTVLITGGGAYNTFLINRLESMAESKIIIPSEQIINYKEALIFGLLGVLKLRGKINCLSSVTGAKNDHSTGVIFCP